MLLKSNYRNGFIIQSITYFVLLCGASYLIFLALKDDGTDLWFNKYRYIIGLVAFLWMWVGYLIIGYYTTFTIILTTHDIEVRRLFGVVRKYEYSQIVSTNTERITNSYSWYNSAFEKLNLNFSDNSNITISGNMFENYNQIKSFVYEQLSAISD